MKFAHDVIIKPIITEDSMARLAEKKYTFKVAKTANKVEIKKAVEEIFKVEVAKVNTISVRGQERAENAKFDYKKKGDCTLYETYYI